MSDGEQDDAAQAEVTPAPTGSAQTEPVDVVGAEYPPPGSAAGPLSAAPAEETNYTSSGVPTFDYAREKIENRYGTAMGAAELAAETPEGRTVEEQFEVRQQAAAERLAQIRAAMRGDRTDDA